MKRDIRYKPVHDAYKASFNVDRGYLDIKKENPERGRISMCHEISEHLAEAAKNMEGVKKICNKDLLIEMCDYKIFCTALNKYNKLPTDARLRDIMVDIVDYSKCNHIDTETYSGYDQNHSWTRLVFNADIE